MLSISRGSRTGQEQMDFNWKVLFLVVMTISASSCKECSTRFQGVEKLLIDVRVLTTVTGACSRLQCSQRCSLHPQCTAPLWISDSRTCLLRKAPRASPIPSGNLERGLVLVPIEEDRVHASDWSNRLLCSDSCSGRAEIPLYRLACPAGQREWWSFEKSRASYPHAKFQTSFSDSIRALTMCYWMQEAGTSDSKAAPVLYGNAKDDKRCNDFSTFLRNDHVDITVNNEEVAVSNVNIRDDIPHHICLQWKSVNGNWRLFRDGTVFAQGSGVSRNGKLSGGGHLFVGLNANARSTQCSAHSGDAFFGRIAQVNLWERYLSEEQITQNYKLCNSSFAGLAFSFLSSSPSVDESSRVPFCAKAP